MLRQLGALIALSLFIANCTEQGSKRAKEETYEIPEYVTGEITVN